jgi:hypothetical protein
MKEKWQNLMRLTRLNKTVTRGEVVLILVLTIAVRTVLGV